MRRPYESENADTQLLLVEDERELAELVVQALEEEGHAVAHASSVLEAMGLIEQERFDGAVLDVELRDGVVFPVADRLAQLGVPYVFASAVYDQIVPVRHRAARFVAKPFHVEDLRDAVQDALTGGGRTR